MKTGRLKKAIDIYSFGVVLFEILFGKLANDPIYTAEDEYGIAQVARRRFEEKTIHEMVDPKIMEEVDELASTLHKGPNQDSLRTILEIAYRCVAITQDERPMANNILEELQKASSFQENSKDTLQMSFEEIKLATENFHRENMIGGGGFGRVFKGEVIRGNQLTIVVAKRLDRSQGQGEHHFLTELEILFEYKHENIIGLEGYCIENDEKIIVYEHASNRSLDIHLNNISLTWTKRLKICIDVARGLAFLHGGAPTKEMVIHRDIKSANILLNADWKAKISDFGLSAITAIDQEVISMLVGTIGYVDPVYEISGFFTEKSDIYSLGVVLTEILSGQLLVPSAKDYDQQHVSTILKHVHEEGKLGLIVFDG
ncbi:putative serine/threonine-protein kinase PBL26 [Bidens hawaiensis]|uniref:putative serine/threonine-protein kinase PBL26 n=1 Tax=Bidens hawaiensis TaxID=980011 RepID=UPI00404B3A94